MQVSFVRRIDELGRIVIPKEIRSKLKITSGDLLDLSVNNDSLMIRKSFSLLNLNYVEEIINLVEYLSDYDLILTDSEKVIAKGSNVDNILINEKLSNDLKDLIFEHKSTNFINGVRVGEMAFLNGKVYVKALIKDSNMLGLLILREKNASKDVSQFLNMIAKLLLQ